MLITFTHAYRPCWLANAIELCTKQTRNCVCVTHPLAVYKTARCSLILPTKTLVRTRYVQFTYFMGRVYYQQCPVSLRLKRQLLCHIWFRASFYLDTIQMANILTQFWMNLYSTVFAHPEVAVQKLALNHLTQWQEFKFKW